MKYNFFRRLLIAWRFTRTFPYAAIPRGYWSVEDARALSYFMTGQTGTKLRVILRNKCEQSMVSAVLESGQRAQHLCGFAAGVRGTLAEMDQLLIIPNTEAEGLGEDEFSGTENS